MALGEVGGVRRDLTPDEIQAALKRLPRLEERITKYADMLAEEQTVLLRFKGVGHLTKEQALKLGTVGPTARASGVDYDIRKDDPYIAYADVPWKVVTDQHGDVFGRTLVRVGELQDSLQIVRYCLENLPAGPIRAASPRAAPRAEILSRYEAPRGELVHFIRTNNTDKVERLDIRTPSLANWTSVAVSLVNQNLADIPVVVAAIDQIDPYRRKEVELTAELGDAPVPAHVDPLQMQEVFVNLLRNALEATDRGAVTVRLETRPGYRVATIADTGHGIPEEIRARIFQPFVSTKRHKGGTGLGLALSRNIVTSHGGEIQFTTSPGKGITVTIGISNGNVW